MISLQDENLISLAAAPAEVPGRPHSATLQRWRLKGLCGVKLETVLVGGRRFTSREALERFFNRVTAARDGQPLPSRTPRQRQRAIEAAERELGS